MEISDTISVLFSLAREVCRELKSVYATTFIFTVGGLDYFCHCTQIIIIFCTQIQT